MTRADNRPRATDASDLDQLEWAVTLDGGIGHLARAGFHPEPGGSTRVVFFVPLCNMSRGEVRAGVVIVGGGRSRCMACYRRWRVRIRDAQGEDVTGVMVREAEV